MNTESRPGNIYVGPCTPTFWAQRLRQQWTERQRAVSEAIAHTRRLVRVKYPAWPDWCVGLLANLLEAKHRMPWAVLARYGRTRRFVAAERASGRLFA